MTARIRADRCLIDQSTLSKGNLKTGVSIDSILKLDDSLALGDQKYITL